MARWENLTMPGFETLRQQTQTVILPLGSLEEHGPHLPLGTDTLHAMEVARRVGMLRPVGSLLGGGRFAHPTIYESESSSVMSMVAALLMPAGLSDRDAGVSRLTRPSAPLR